MKRFSLLISLLVLLFAGTAVYEIVRLGDVKKK